MALSAQLFWLLVLAIPIASVAWTITHEEVFSEARYWCEKNSKECRTLVQRKFFYLFTCEYCFSHWVTAFFLIVTRFKLLFTGLFDFRFCASLGCQRLYEFFCQDSA
jgi:hypothetical protein